MGMHVVTESQSGVAATFGDMWNSTFQRLEYARLPDDPASQDCLREIRQLLGDPAA